MSEQSAENVRTFVAIELDAEVHTALREVQGRLRRAPLARLGRWVESDGIHLTLRFLGDVPAARVPELRRALECACQGIMPFEIAVAGLGFFPNGQRLRVIWAGVEEPSGALQRLQLAVERQLEQIGFRPEGRGFSPHLTLARVRDQACDRERAELGAWIKQQAVGRLATMRVRQVSLMQSTLRREGAIYTCLASTVLQGPEEG